MLCCGKLKAAVYRCCVLLKGTKAADVGGVNREEKHFPAVQDLGSFKSLLSSSPLSSSPPLLLSSLLLSSSPPLLSPLSSPLFIATGDKETAVIYFVFTVSLPPIKLEAMQWRIGEEGE